MSNTKYKYIYGPVSSWRLGSSLGIDLLSQDRKICTFNCLYCQLGGFEEYTNQRKAYVPTKDVMAEIKSLPDVKIDYFTFSGRGEPTLAKNLGEAINELRKIRKEQIAVLTNSTLLQNEEVRKELALADYVALKLDACSQATLESINKPAPEIKFDELLESIKIFRNNFSGTTALQMMFVDENEGYAEKFVELAREIAPDEVQINTPLRACRVKPLSKEKLHRIKELFSSLPMEIKCVYEAERKEAAVISKEDTLKRRGCTN
ncbi:MAG: radical SAM protein [Candidatus Omnitrophica bacterium]|nr:radical SAM protein [Candidatus Omnitrophota bacterium]